MMSQPWLSIRTGETQTYTTTEVWGLPAIPKSKKEKSKTRDKDGNYNLDSEKKKFFRKKPRGDEKGLNMLNLHMKSLVTFKGLFHSLNHFNSSMNHKQLQYGQICSSIHAY